MVLEMMAELGKHMISNARLSSRGRSIVRKTIPFLAIALLMLSFLVSILPGVVLQEQKRANDGQNIVTVMATGTPPEFNETLPPTIFVVKGVMATFNITVYDADDDPVHVEWSWGDGSLNATNDTPPALTAQPVNQTHTWDPYVEQGSGDFYISFPDLNVTIDDGNGNFVTISRPVQVYVPMNVPPTVGILGPSAAVDPLDNVTVYANASDPEGEPLTWTFVFNDTYSDFLTIVNYTGATAPNELVWNNISYIFQIEGQYTVTVYVSDALPPNQTFPHNMSAVVTVFAVWNVAPVTSSEVAANPSAPVLDPVTKSVFVNYSVQAADQDGDVMTATWDFGDGGSGAVNVSGGTAAMYTFVQMRKYTTPGTFNVSVAISDGRLNHTVTLYRIMTVNSPPKFNQTLFPKITPTNGVPLTINIIVYDADNDPVHVEWSWGDGSLNSTNDTPPAFTAQPVSQTHTWTIPVEQGSGDFNVSLGRLNVTISDPNGSSTTVSRPVSLFVPANQSPHISMVGPTTVDPSDNVTFIANASDPEGESLTWTFIFNDSQTDFLTIVKHTGPTAPDELLWNNVSHVFGAVGVYTVTMWVSDALPPNQTGVHNLSLTITETVMVNIAPGTSLDIAADPIQPVINSTIGYILVNYSVEAYDSDGDVLTATWNFGDGGPGEVNVSPGGSSDKYKFIQTRNYTDTGVHNISVVISDGRVSHTVILYRNITVSSTNLPPNVIGLVFNYPSGDYALPNQTLTFIYTFTDPERDPIQVVVDFGDGSFGYYNVTEYDAIGNASLTITHAFSDVGSKKIEVFYTDNKIGLYDHFLYQNLTIEVNNPTYVAPNNWSWWDYTSLVMICMIPVLVALRLLMVNARRKRLEEEGLSIEEWKVMKSVQLDQKGKDSKGK